jgi:hypothetical protein
MIQNDARQVLAAANIIVSTTCRRRGSILRTHFALGMKYNSSESNSKNWILVNPFHRSLIQSFKASALFLVRNQSILWLVV